jgi:hypothetical protein
MYAGGRASKDCKELDIPDELMVVIGIAIGYEDVENPQNKFRTTRRSVQEAVTFKGRSISSGVYGRIDYFWGVGIYLLKRPAGGRRLIYKHNHPSPLST